MSNVQENVRILRALEAKCPGKIKIIQSESDVDSVDMDAVMKSVHKDFANDDLEMAVFIKNKLESGKEVVVLAAGKTKIMVFAVNGLIKRSFSLDMNKSLWKDELIFQKYFAIALYMNKTVADNKWDTNIFLKCANEFDDIMQEYEGQYGSIEDPIFYWSFATANALFLLIGKKYDELGDTRISYVINGYKEGFSKHIACPSYPKIYSDKAFEHMAPFAEGEDAEWINNNRSKYSPIPG